jgi:hypothetical protein
MGRARRISGLIVVILALGGAAGCYSFAPVASPTVGMDVRARLRIEAAIRRSAEVDEPVLNVDGRVVAASADAISLDVLIARSQSVFQDIVIRDTVTFQMAELERVMERKFSPAKTGLFAVASGVGVFLVVNGISQIVGGNEEEPPDGGTTSIVVPGFRKHRLTGFSIPLFRFR